MNHQIGIQKYYAGSYAVMCGHIQATLCCIADLGILNYTKTPKLTGTTYTVTPKQMAQCKLPMKWLCKMANSVMGVNGELLEYCHLIANQTTRATWQHSYGNEIGCLAQVMSGRNTGNNTIIFISKNQVPQNSAKDVTYTCLIRPEKIEEPNQTRLVARATE
jgi:hypothetical protein